jgi:hypothetical protein
VSDVGGGSGVMTCLWWVTVVSDNSSCDSGSSGVVSVVTGDCGEW